MNSPPVPVVSPPEPPQALTLSCANCHATLTGEYCAACGQRHEPHLHTVAHFAGEAFESLSHADSRLWRTLWYLLARPGFLTRQFFDGKRARYLPPFRLYLVISLLFFVVVTHDSNINIRTDATGAERIEQLKATASKLRKDAETDAGPAADALRITAAALERQAAADSAALEGDPDASLPKGLARTNVFRQFCGSFEKADPKAGANYERMRSACSKITDDGGAELGKTVVHNIPKAMFLFLPLLALVMKAMYWRPKRYYVEHLLFLIHNHAFVFLALTILALVKMIPVVGEHVGAFEAFVWLYLLWYLFRAMRNVYHQGRTLTLAKYFTIGFAYTVAAVTVLVLTAVYSAFTIA